MQKTDPSAYAYLPYQPGFEQYPDYRNYVVPAGHPLFNIVSDFYQFSVKSKTETKICVIPDGCADIIFRYGENGVTKTIERSLREKQVFTISEEGCAFGVRFLPGRMTSVINVYAAELMACDIPLMDVLKKDPLLDKMEEAFSFEERINLMSRYLITRLSGPNASQGLVRYCTGKIFAQNGNVSIAELASETGYTSRYVREVFCKNVGLSPKELSEIIQFQKSFFDYASRWKRNNIVSLCDMAQLYGYYDQSHMNKTYRKMAGCLPKKLFSEIYSGACAAL